jgi:hypothetical protein
VPAKLEMRERAGNEVHSVPAWSRMFWELGDRLVSMIRLQVGCASKKYRLQWNFRSSQKAFALLGSWNQAARCR